MADLKDKVIIKLLELIDYSGDKEKFANSFIEICQQEAIADLYSSLPKDKQIKLQQEISEQEDLTKVQQVFKKYFSGADYGEALKKSTQANFEDYIQSVFPQISDEQQNKVMVFLDSIVQEFTQN